MLNYLSELNVTGGFLVAIVVIMVSVELLKAGSYLWDFFKKRFFGIKSKYDVRKDLDETVMENQRNIQEILKNQIDHETLDHTIVENRNAIGSLASSQEVMSEKIGELADTVQDVSEVVVSIQIENMRNVILEFATDVANGKSFTKEQYEHVRKTYKSYNEVIKKRNLTNDEVDISYEIIDQAYRQHIRNRDFIEHKLDDLGFQSEFLKNYVKTE